MKIIVIALMIFFLNLSVAMIDLLDIYVVNAPVDKKWLSEVESAVAVQSLNYDPDIAAEVSTSFGFGDFVTGFLRFRDMLYRVVNVSATIRLFDSKNEWGAIPTFFGFAASIIYIVGIAQFISNRSTKGMQ